MEKRVTELCLSNSYAILDVHWCFNFGFSFNSIMRRFCDEGAVMVNPIQHI